MRRISAGVGPPALSSGEAAAAMSVAADDEKLAKLKLPSNDLCQEGGTLTEAEEKKLATEIVSKLSARRRPRGGHPPFF